MKTLVALLLSLLLAAPASAGPIRDAIRDKPPQAIQPDTEKNPYLWPGVALIGAGAGLLLAAFFEGEGFAAGAGTDFGSIHGGVAVYGRGVNRNTAFGIGGAALIAVGTAVIITGEKKKGGTTLSIRPGGVAVTRSVRF
jgi:hypothetical protein